MTVMQGWDGCNAVRNRNTIWGGGKLSCSEGGGCHVGEKGLGVESSLFSSIKI
jgi:hypothetical protein